MRKLCQNFVNTCKLCQNFVNFVKKFVNIANFVHFVLTFCKLCKQLLDVVGLRKLYLKKDVIDFVTLCKLCNTFLNFVNFVKTL